MYELQFVQNLILLDENKSFPRMLIASHFLEDGRKSVEENLRLALFFIPV